MDFSIIIPTVGRPELDACLDAVEVGCQSLREQGGAVEVIVAHDRFSDENERRIVQRHPEVKVIVGPQKGPAANRNAGAAKASGRWLVFTDDDCLPAPDWLAALAQIVAADQADVIEGKTVCRTGLPGPQWHSPLNETGGFLWSCNFAVRRDLFCAIGGFDERFPFAHMEDADLKKRLEALGAQLVFAPGVVVDHPPRRLPGPLTLARHHESELLFNRIHFQHPCPMNVLFRLAKTRSKVLMERGSCAEKTMFALSIFLELLCTAALCPLWLSRLSREVKLWTAEMAVCRFHGSGDDFRRGCCS